MRRFHFYIDDQNHAHPVEFTVEVTGIARARELAEELLARSSDHLGVEVCENGYRVFGLGTFATRTHCGLRPEPLGSSSRRSVSWTAHPRLLRDVATAARRTSQDRPIGRRPQALGPSGDSAPFLESHMRMALFDETLAVMDRAMAAAGAERQALMEHALILRQAALEEDRRASNANDNPPRTERRRACAAVSEGRTAGAVRSRPTSEGAPLRLQRKRTPTDAVSRHQPRKRKIEPPWKAT